MRKATRFLSITIIIGVVCLRTRPFRTKAGDAYVAYSRALTLADDKGYGDALWKGIELYDRALARPQQRRQTRDHLGQLRDRHGPVHDATLRRPSSACEALVPRCRTAS